MEYIPDFGDPDLYSTGHPYALLAPLRERAPLHRLKSAVLDHEFWGVFRYDEGRRVLADSTTFGSRYGVFPWNGPHSPDPSAQSILIASDDPHRALLRTALHDLFSPAAVASRRGALLDLIADLLEPRLGAAPFEFGAEVAWPLAVAVVTEVVGATDPQLPAALSGILAETDMSDGFRRDRAAASISFAVAAELVNVAVPAAPRGTLLARLREVTERDPGVAKGPSAGRDVLANAIGVLVGGIEAPRLVLTGAMVLLAREPQWLERLRARPEMLPGLVDELLRWTAPTTLIGRTALVDTAIAGIPVARGDVVRVLPAAANRDPRRFRNPDVFDPTRTGASLAFGHGPHHCIGAGYARDQLMALLEFLRDRPIRLREVGPSTMSRSNSFVGYLTSMLSIDF